MQFLFGFLVGLDRKISIIACSLVDIAEGCTVRFSFRWTAAIVTADTAPLLPFLDPTQQLLQISSFHLGQGTLDAWAGGGSHTAINVRSAGFSDLFFLITGKSKNSSLLVALGQVKVRYVVHKQVELPPGALATGLCGVSDDPYLVHRTRRPFLILCLICTWS